MLVLETPFCLHEGRFFSMLVNWELLREGGWVGVGVAEDVLEVRGLNDFPDLWKLTINFYTMNCRIDAEDETEEKQSVGATYPYPPPLPHLETLQNVFNSRSLQLYCHAHHVIIK